MIILNYQTMDKKIITAAIVGAIVSFLLGWLIYGFLLMDYYTAYSVKYEGLMKDPPELWAYFANGLCWSYLLAYIFSKWSNTSTFGKGVVNAGFIGFFISLSYDFNFYAGMNLMSKRLLVVDVVVATIYIAIVGGVVAWVLGYGKKSEAAS